MILSNYPKQFHNFIVVPTTEYRRSKNKVLHTTKDINVSIKSTLFENIPAPFLHDLTLAGAIDRQPRVCSVLQLLLLCGRDASEPEIVLVDIQSIESFHLGVNIFEMDSQLTCRRAKSIASGYLLCEKF